MMSFQIVEYVNSFLIVLCVLDVYCQRIRFEETSTQSSCSADSTCRPLRRCRAYRDRPNWQDLGVTCGPGQAEFRMVCCPRYFGALRTQPLDTTTPIAIPTRPETPMPTSTSTRPLTPMSASTSTRPVPSRPTTPIRTSTIPALTTPTTPIRSPTVKPPAHTRPAPTKIAAQTASTKGSINISNPSGIRFEEPSPRNTCPADSTCRPLRNCRAYRGRPSSVGVTCGPGRGESRRVCCPTRLNTPLRAPTPRLTTPRPPAPRPTAQTPSPTVFLNPNDASGCGRSTPENVRQRYIMGGQNSTQGQWPWLVAIPLVRPSGSFSPHCTGVLIDQRHVMSAAHCFDNRDVNRYQGRIGNIDLTVGEAFPIVRIAIPSGYRRGMYYDDIAILTLGREVSPALANPICLPDATIMSMNFTNTGTSVAGWGMVGPDGPVSLTLKHLQRMPVWSNSDCESVFRNEISSFRRQFPRGIDSGFLCAGYREGGRDACGGDSGGPLMKQHNDRWFVVGIVSFGNSCGRPNMPGGYTKVSQYMNWILDNTRD